MCDFDRDRPYCDRESSYFGCISVQMDRQVHGVHHVPPLQSKMKRSMRSLGLILLHSIECVSLG